MNNRILFGRNPLILLLLLGLCLSTLALIAHNRAPVSADSAEHMVALPIVFNNSRGASNPFFGVQMYGSTSNDSKYNSFARSSGSGSVRVLFAMPPNAPDNTDWTAIDTAFSIAYQVHGNLNLVPVMDGVPSWAAPSPREPLYDDRYDELAAFMAQVVERYDGDGIDDAPGSPVITYWEMYNEPDGNELAAFSPRWGNDGDKYAHMLRTIYPAIKAANPNAKVTFGGIAYDWFEDQDGIFVRHFLDDVLAAGACDYFDVMNFHAYPAFSTNWTTNQGIGLLEKAEAVRDKLAEYGCAKPMIITEAGWHSDVDHPYPSSLEEQARFVVQIFTQSAAADIDLTIWWMLYDPGGGYSNNGLVTNATVPQLKPSYHAFKFLTEILQYATFNKQYTTAELGNELMEMYRFRDPVSSRDVYVAWLNPVKSTASDTVQITGESATVYDIYGEARPVADNDDGVDDGKLTIQVKSQPVYVSVDR